MQLVDAYGRPLTREAAEGAPERRSDAWVNPMTGLGTSADKTMHGRYMPVRRLTDQELVNLCNGSALAAKIAWKRPLEMFRRGYELISGDDEVDKTDAKDLFDYANEELHVDEVFLEAKKFAELLGGNLVVMGIDDGGEMSEPLDESRIRSFTFLNSIDRRFTYVLDYYSEPGPKYGRPQHYLTSNAIGGYQSGSGAGARTEKIPARLLEARGYHTAVIHESRCLRFEGVSTDVVTMQSLAGWTWSRLQRVYDGLRKFEHSFDSANYLLSDAAQAVFKLSDLMSAINAGEFDAVEKRALELERTRSIMRAVVIDKDETFERQGTPLTGVADILDRMMLRLCADTEYPMTELFGRAASGLNAAAGSDAEERKWYDVTASQAKTELGPLYKRFYRLLSASRDCPVTLPKKGKNGKPLKWEAKFRPLFQPTDKEQAEVDKIIAERNQIYLAEEVITKEECALEVAELYPSMDIEARKAAMKGAEAFDPYENDEPPEGETFGGEVPSGNAAPVTPGIVGNVPAGPVAAPGPAAPATPAPPAKKTAKAPPAKAAAKKTAAKPGKPARGA